MIHLSVIIPVRNEAEHITEVLDRLLAQQYETGKLEILVVDGMSDDATPQIVQKYAQEHSHIRYLENPKKLSSAARNVGIQNAQGEAVLIVDGHCIIDNDDMLRNVSEAFTKSGADCLGRPQPLEMKDATPLQWAIATARRSPLGHHPDSFVYSDQACFAPASSVAVAYRKSVFEKVGLFDENFDACEDVEMNTRIDAAGLKCWFDPAIAVRYVPRKTLRGLRTQMERYGHGRVRLWRKHRHTASWKSFAPGFFVVGAIVAGLILLSHTAMCLTPEYFGMVRGLSPFNALAWISVVLLGTYAMAILAESIHALLRLIFFQKESEPAERRAPFLCPTVFAIIHFGYGWGILREFFFPKRVVSVGQERGAVKGT